MLNALGLTEEELSLDREIQPTLQEMQHLPATRVSMPRP